LKGKLLLLLLLLLLLFDLCADTGYFLDLKKMYLKALLAFSPISTWLLLGAAGLQVTTYSQCECNYPCDYDNQFQIVLHSCVQVNPWATAINLNGNDRSACTVYPTPDCNDTYGSQNIGIYKNHNDGCTNAGFEVEWIRSINCHD
jgi:hypothetical protein